ncbi:MAG TPA: hypothetical protein VET48_09550, partial [Steroidobacteraceae bacterium]|nr:hypothetical protein [Steroidobacteraceae bacterium]
MQQVFNSTLRFGNAALDRDLSASGDGPFDWSRHIRVTFDRPFGAPIPGRPKDVQQAISVVCTPRSPGVPVVAVDESVDATGFTFRVRNADPNRGASNVTVDWLAVLGVPDANPTLAQQIDARFSIVQPKSFDGFLNDKTWPRIWYSEPLQPQPSGTPARILLTESDLHCLHNNPASIAMVGPLGDSDSLLKHGIIDGANDFGFSVFAVDVDTVGGNCAFYAASFVKSTNQL